jgi:hypothetical protein
MMQFYLVITLFFLLITLITLVYKFVGYVQKLSYEIRVLRGLVADILENEKLLSAEIKSLKPIELVEDVWH